MRRISHTDRQIQLGLGFLRIATGLIFAAHGYQKFFTMGIDGVTGFFTGLGVPLPGIAAIVVAVLELVGGLALASGLLTRLIAMPLALDMLGAIVFFHSGFFIPKGVEFVLMLMVASIALALAGPGAFAIDGLLGAARNPSQRKTYG